MEFIRPTNPTSYQIIKKHLGLTEFKASIRCTGHQAQGRSLTIVAGRQTFQRHTYAPHLGYYNVETTDPKNWIFPRDLQCWEKKKS